MSFVARRDFYSAAAGGFCSKESHNVVISSRNLYKLRDARYGSVGEGEGGNREEDLLQME